MQKLDLKIEFETVFGSEEQVLALYALLKQRKHTISHDKLPAFEDHKHFVLNHPYVDWFIIRNGDELMGSFYTKADNSIGLNLLVQDQQCVANVIHFIRLNLRPQPASSSEVPTYFFLNIPYSNIELQKILADNDIVPIQVSYML